MTTSNGDVTSVQVALRIRPLSEEDISRAPAMRGLPQEVLAASHPVSQQPRVTVTPYKQQFVYDQVFDPSTTQNKVFDACVIPLLDKFLEGFNATILAYGQTSSGKTYTMGTAGNVIADDNSRGIIPRAVDYLFSVLTSKPPHLLKYQVRVSFLELYNEELIDLLSGNESGRLPITIREDARGNIIWTGVREARVYNARDVLRYLSEGSHLRQVGSTDMNEQSSRSHAIFSVTLRQERWIPYDGKASRNALTPTGRHSSASRSISPSSGMNGGGSERGRKISANPGELQTEGEWQVMQSKFHFVDLAGSERLKRTHAVGERAREGISINAGLSALGNVISALGDTAKKAVHIPYRDSKLTRLLQDSLGGNSQTLMIACVSAAASNLTETINTLKYANRARNIKNKAVQNEEMSQDVDQLQATVSKLKAELRQLKGQSIQSDDGDFMQALSEISFMRKRNESLEEELEKLTEAYHVLESQLARKEAPRSFKIGSFQQDVEPVIEEYEKVVHSLEDQLRDAKEALAAAEANSQIVAAKLRFEETVRESNGIVIAELKARVLELQQAEQRSHDYVRELEAKINGNSYLELETDAQRLRMELAAERAEVERLSAELNLHQHADVATLVEMVAELEDKVKALEPNRSIRRMTSQRLRSVNRDSMTSVASDQTQVQPAEALESELQKLSEARTQMEAQYQESLQIQQKQILQEQEARKNDKEEHIITVMELKKQLSQLSSELNDTSASYKEQVQELQQQIQELRSRLFTYPSDLEWLKQELERLTAPTTGITSVTDDGEGESGLESEATVVEDEAKKAEILKIEHQIAEIEQHRLQEETWQRRIEELEQLRDEDEVELRMMSGLIEELQERLDETRQIAAQGAELQSTLDTKVRRIRELEERVDQMEASEVILNEKSADLNNQLLESEKVRLTLLNRISELERLEVEYTELSTLQHQQVDINDKLQQQLKQTESELQEQLSLHSQESNHLKEQLIAVNNALTFNLALVGEKDKHIESLEHKLAETRGLQSSELNKQLELQKSLESHNTLLEQTRLELQEKLDQLVLAEGKEQELGSKIAALQSQQDAYMVEIKKLQDELQAAESLHLRASESWEKERAAMLEKDAQRMETISQLEKEIQEKQHHLLSALASQEGAEIAVADELNQYQKQVHQLQADVNEYRDLIHSLEGSMEELKQRNVVALKEQADILGKEKEISVSAVKTELAVLVITKQQQEGQIEAQKRELDQIKQQILSKEQEFAEKEAESIAMIEALNVEIIQLKSLEEEISSLQSRISEQALEIKSKDAEINELKQLFDEVSLDTDKEASTLRKQVDELIKEKNQMESQIKELMDKEEGLKRKADNRVKQVEADLAEISNLCEQLEAQLNNQTKESERYKGKVDQLESQLASANDTISQHEVTLSHQVKLIKMQEDHLSTLEKTGSRRPSVPDRSHNRSVSSIRPIDAVPPTPPPSIPPPTPAPVRSRSPSPPIPSSASRTPSTAPPPSADESRMRTRLKQLEDDLRGHVGLIQTLEQSLDESEQEKRQMQTLMDQLKQQAQQQQSENKRINDAMQSMRTRLDEMRKMFEEEQVRGAQVLEQNRELERRMIEMKMKKSRFVCF